MRPTMGGPGLRAVAGLTAAALLSGCATSYTPKSPSRISIVMQGGNIAYQRGGQTYSDFLGGGLVDAVEGDPEATEAAETYYHRNIGGLAALVVGVGCLAGGVAALTVNQPPSEERQTLGLGALVCALAGEITALSLLASARPYQLDAINIYNDHAERRMRTPRYPYPPPGYYPPPVPMPRPTAPPAATPSAPPPAPSQTPPASSTAPEAASTAPAPSAAPPTR